MRPRRAKLTLIQTPMAVTSDGVLLANLAYVADLRDVEETQMLIDEGTLEGKLFVGLVLDHQRTEDALRRLDDAAAECVATIGILSRGPKRGQR